MARLEFDRVFREEYPRLVALGTSVSGDREVAHELAQETMLRAHANWATLESYEQPGAWLRRVMSNLLIDHHRSATSERAALARIGRGEGATSTVVPSWSELIAPLTARQRVVATLFYAEDRSVADIATDLGISTGAVKSTLAKVRRRLRSTSTRGEV